MTAFAASMSALIGYITGAATDLFSAISPVIGVVFAAGFLSIVLSALRKFLP